MMKPRRKSRVEGRGPAACATVDSFQPLTLYARSPRGFTLIELMVVMGIMAIIFTIGIPSILLMWRKEGMRKATADVLEVCSKARAQAILSGTPKDIVFHPRERRLAIGGGGGDAPPPEGDSEGAVRSPSASGSSAEIPEDITIEMLDINLLEYRESDWARVRFFPNGMCDEMTLILRSSKNEWKKITLEVTTGLASVDNVIQ